MKNDISIRGYPTDPHKSMSKDENPPPGGSQHEVLDQIDNHFRNILK